MTVHAGKGGESTCMKSSKQNRRPRQSVGEQACHYVTRSALSHQAHPSQVDTLRSLGTHIQQLHHRLLHDRLCSPPQGHKKEKNKAVADGASLAAPGVENPFYIQDKFVEGLRDVMAAPNSSVRVITPEAVVTRSRSQRLAASALSQPLPLISLSAAVGGSEEAPVKSPSPALGLPASPFPAATLRSKAASLPCTLNVSRRSRPSVRSPPVLRSKSKHPHVPDQKTHNKPASPEVLELLKKSPKLDEQNLVLYVEKELPKVILDSEVSLQQEIECDEKLDAEPINNSDLTEKLDVKPINNPDLTVKQDLFNDSINNSNLAIKQDLINNSINNSDLAIKQDLIKDSINNSDLAIKQDLINDSIINSDLAIKQELINNSQVYVDFQEDQLVDVVDCKSFLSVEAASGENNSVIKETQSKTTKVIIMKTQIPIIEVPAEPLEKKLIPIAPKLSTSQSSKSHLISIHSPVTTASSCFVQCSVPQQTAPRKNVRILPLKPAIPETKPGEIVPSVHQSSKSAASTIQLIPKNSTQIEPVNAMRKIFKSNRKRTVKYNFSLDHNERRRIESSRKKLVSRKRKPSPDPAPTCCDPKERRDEDGGSQDFPRDDMMLGEDQEYQLQLDKFLLQSSAATKPLWCGGELEDLLATHDLNECPFNFETPSLEELLGLELTDQSETSLLADTSPMLNPCHN